MSWIGGGTAGTRLSDWLDPSGSGAMTTITTNIALLTPTTFSISGLFQFCTTSYPYSVPGLPNGATIVWSATPTGVVTINSPNSPTTTLTRIINGSITLIATISNVCGSAPIVITKPVQSGDAEVSSINLSWLTPCYGNSQLVKLDATPTTGGTNWYWTVNQGQFAFTTDRHLPSVEGYVTGYALLTLSYTGTFCGTSLTGGVTAYTNCSYRLSVYPNPSTDVINLTIDNGGDVINKNELSSDTTTISRTTKTSLISNTKGTTNIYLYDLYSNQLVKKWSYYENSSDTYNLNVDGIKRGIYVLKVERDNTLSTIKIILQ